MLAVREYNLILLGSNGHLIYKREAFGLDPQFPNLLAFMQTCVGKTEGGRKGEKITKSMLGKP